MNVVTLIGDLASGVELREVSGDKRVASFLLAVDRPGEGADFIRVSTWNKQAELCGRYLGKGRRVAVEGRLRSRSWDEGDGKRRSAVEVVASHVQFLSAPGERSASETPFEPASVA